MDLMKKAPFGRLESTMIFEGDKSLFPGLAARFDVLEAEVEPEFEALDLDALTSQRRHRRVRLALMILAFSATVLGALQAASGGEVWAGVAVLVVAAMATVVSAVEAETTPAISYLKQRARAEQLRSIYFRFLAGDDGGVPQDQWANWLAGQVAGVKSPSSAKS